MHSPDFLFPRFLVFPPANPSNFSHCKCFSIRIPFLFQYRSIICTFKMKCISGTSRSSIEVQDEKTGKMRRHAGLIIIMLNDSHEV